MKEEVTGDEKAKGILKNMLTHENYKNTFFEKKQLRDNNKTIQIKSPQSRTFEANKVSSLCYHDKQYVLSDDTKNVACKHKHTK